MGTNHQENHHIDALIVKTMQNHQRRLSPPDCTTEVTFCHSKSNSWTTNTNDEIVQTDQSLRRTSILNGNHSDAHNAIARKQSFPRRNDQLNDTLLSTTTAKLRRPSAAATSQSLPKSATSNLVLGNENPWRKLGNVRYKLDEPSQTTSKRPEPIYAQHITFV